jgi:CheY-like chemotaxis protein
MNADAPLHDHPGQLARCLAELRLRLRPSGSGTGRIPPDLPALKVTAALLPVLADRAPGLVALGRELDRLLVSVENQPALWPPHLDQALNDLALFLDGIMAAADTGIMNLSGLPGWFRQMEIWRDAATPREVFHDLDRTLERWRSRWEDPVVRRDSESVLAPRWSQFRSRGDDLFLPDPGVGDEVDAEGLLGSVILLLDSPFRRDQIVSRLATGGYEPVTATDPREAAGLEPELRPVAILADNLAPHNHLTSLFGLRNGGGTNCPLVLVSSGNGVRDREHTRARRLGARAAWCDPFLTPDLNRILQQPSHS